MADRPYSNAPRLPEGDCLDPREVLGATAPIELEIGPGRGWFMIERLEAYPDAFMMGLEIRRKWATIVDDRLRSRGLAERGRVFAEDIKAVLPRFVEASVSAVFVNFPDPWWKKRHEKRSVLNATVLLEIARVLVPGGELFIQTDVEERAERYAALVAAEEAFAPFEGGPRVAENPFGARSPRERRTLEDGLPVARLRYRRR